MQLLGIESSKHFKIVLLGVLLNVNLLFHWQNLNKLFQMSNSRFQRQISWSIIKEDLQNCISLWYVHNENYVQKCQWLYKSKNVGELLFSNSTTDIASWNFYLFPHFYSLPKQRAGSQGHLYICFLQILLYHIWLLLNTYFHFCSLCRFKRGKKESTF